MEFVRPFVGLQGAVRINYDYIFVQFRDLRERVVELQQEFFYNLGGERRIRPAAIIQRWFKPRADGVVANPHAIWNGEIVGVNEDGTLLSELVANGDEVFVGAADHSE